MTVSRDYFDENKNWSETQTQEGVPVLDADLNLAARIEKQNLRRAVCETFGNGSSNSGFKLSGSVTNPTISGGNIWVSGLKIELPDDIQASAQPNTPQTFPAGNGVWYLEVVENLITNADDSVIRDSRLPSNVETPIKVWKTEWTLKKAIGSSMPAPADAAVNILVATETSGVFLDERNEGIIAAGVDTGFQGREGGGFKKYHNLFLSGLQGGSANEYYHLTAAERAWVQSGGSGHLSFDHNASLSNLQGGSTNERYHLTSAQQSGLTGGGSTALHTHAHNAATSLEGGGGGHYNHLDANQYTAVTSSHSPSSGNPFATMNDVTGCPKPAVQNIADLPATGNIDKDLRFVEQDRYIYSWESDSSTWIKAGYGGGGVTDHEALTSLQGGAAGDHKHLSTQELSELHSLKQIMSNLPYLEYSPLTGDYIFSTCIFTYGGSNYDIGPDVEGAPTGFSFFTFPGYPTSFPTYLGLYIGADFTTVHTEPYGPPWSQLNINGTWQIDCLLCSKSGNHYTIFVADDGTSYQRGLLTTELQGLGYIIDHSLVNVFQKSVLHGDYVFNTAVLTGGVSLWGGDGSGGNRNVGSPTHNYLKGLQGGSYYERVHVTQAQHDDLVNGGSTTLHKHSHNNMDDLSTGNPHTQYQLASGMSSYLTASEVSSTYETQSHAASTYLTQSAAASTYLTQSGAAATYMTPSEHDSRDHSAVAGSIMLSELGSQDHTELTNIDGNPSFLHLSSVQKSALTGGPTTDAQSFHTHGNISVCKWRIKVNVEGGDQFSVTFNNFISNMEACSSALVCSGSGEIPFMPVASSFPGCYYAVRAEMNLKTAVGITTLWLDLTSMPLIHSTMPVGTPASGGNDGLYTIIGINGSLVAFHQSGSQPGKGYITVPSNTTFLLTILSAFYNTTGQFYQPNGFIDGTNIQFVSPGAA